MIMATKNEVIKEVLSEYLKASKKEKTKILDRLEETVKMHRKAIVRRLRVLQMRDVGINWNDKRGRKIYYGKDVTEALKYLWETAHEICAETICSKRRISGTAYA
jgi:L-lactate utilization protein LutB